MAVYRCAGRKRFDEDGNPYCEHEAGARWTGACPGCGRLYDCEKVGSDKRAANRVTAASAAQSKTEYVSTGRPEVDRVLGGGLVPGCTVLLGGTRGAGKSSLAMDVCDGVAKGARSALFASGEQNEDGVLAICRRMCVSNDRIGIMSNACDADDILRRVEQDKPFLLVVDSLQVVTCSDGKGAEGSIAQVDAVTNLVTAYCARNKICAILLCHVNKEGDLAGSETCQHLVDTITRIDKHVTFTESGEVDERTKGMRVFEGYGKNRNGPDSERAFFEMTEEGLLRPARKSKLILVRS